MMFLGTCPHYFWHKVVSIWGFCMVFETISYKKFCVQIVYFIDVIGWFHRLPIFVVIMHLCSQCYHLILSFVKNMSNLLLSAHLSAYSKTQKYENE